MRFLVQVSGTFGAHSAKFPCSSCVVPHDKLSQWSQRGITTRTESQMKDAVSKIRRGVIKPESVSVHPVDVSFVMFFSFFIMVFK